MKYVSIDIETLGLDINCDIIEFGAVIEDTAIPIDKLPRFRRLIHKMDGLYWGEMGAMAMHGKLFEEMAKKSKGRKQDLFTIDKLMPHFCAFLCENGYFSLETIRERHSSEDFPAVLVGGKNFNSFDKMFINYHCRDYMAGIKFHHRAIDPGMLYFDPAIDEVPPSMKVCLERAGLNGTVAHNAVDDALSVVALVRTKFGISL